MVKFVLIIWKSAARLDRTEKRRPMDSLMRRKQEKELIRIFEFKREKNRLEKIK
jgi:hypothetical protein